MSQPPNLPAKELREILAFQIHDTDYSSLKGQDKLSVDQSIPPILTLIQTSNNEAVVGALESVIKDLDDVGYQGLRERLRDRQNVVLRELVNEEKSDG
jgi:hypothetical protein